MSSYSVRRTNNIEDIGRLACVAKAVGGVLRKSRKHEALLHLAGRTTFLDESSIERDHDHAIAQWTAAYAEWSEKRAIYVVTSVDFAMGTFPELDWTFARIAQEEEDAGALFERYNRCPVAPKREFESLTMMKLRWDLTVKKEGYVEGEVELMHMAWPVYTKYAVMLCRLLKV